MGCPWVTMISKFLLGAMGRQSSGEERGDFVLCIKQEFSNDVPIGVNSVFFFKIKKKSVYFELLRNLNYIKI